MQDTFLTYKTTLNFNGNLEDINHTQVFGILNVTPDSFYDGGKHQGLENQLAQAELLIAQGADFIDVGAYSSRPGADDISEQEETDRLLPIIEAIHAKFPNQKISVDTFRSKVAEAAVKAGACVINDISGGALDTDMYATAGKLNVPYVAMHMPGNPQTMQQHTNYTHLMDEVILDLSIKVDQMLAAGIVDIIIDPGFGFGKTVDQNYEMLKHLNEFHMLGHPVLVGISRKSMIYKPLNITPQEALNGTTALHMLALQNGANFLRVHDVKAAKEAIDLWQLYTQQP